MPTASEEVRKPWHNKAVWVKLRADVDRKSLGAIVIFGNWALIPGCGDSAAEDYLRKRGYIEHRFMWYRPKKSLRVPTGMYEPDWAPTKKEASALTYLCDEWDHSYDLRDHKEILKDERAKMVQHVLVDMGIKDAPVALDRALKFYSAFERKLLG